MANGKAHVSLSVTYNSPEEVTHLLIMCQSHDKQLQRPVERRRAAVRLARDGQRPKSASAYASKPH